MHVCVFVCVCVCVCVCVYVCVCVGVCVWPIKAKWLLDNGVMRQLKLSLVGKGSAAESHSQGPIAR